MSQRTIKDISQITWYLKIWDAVPDDAREPLRLRQTAPKHTVDGEYPIWESAVPTVTASHDTRRVGDVIYRSAPHVLVLSGRGGFSFIFQNNTYML